MFSSVGYELFYNIPVHQRFTAEEIYLEVSSAAGVCDQEIKRFFADFQGHQCTSSVILALFCEAVTTGKVTVVCNVEAECFYDGRTVGKLINCVFVNVFCKRACRYL